MKHFKTLTSATLIASAIFISLTACQKEEPPTQKPDYKVNLKSANAGSNKCEMTPTVLVCESHNSPIKIDDGCYCPKPCVNCGPTIIIKSPAILSFINAFESGTLPNFFTSTQWTEVFPHYVGTNFNLKVISGEINFHRAIGIDSNAGQHIYIALENWQPVDTVFLNEQVVFALPITID